jgi:hypothetical protein
VDPAVGALTYASNRPFVFVRGGDGDGDGDIGVHWFTRNSTWIWGNQGRV